MRLQYLAPSAHAQTRQQRNLARSRELLHQAKLLALVRYPLLLRSYDLSAVTFVGVLAC